MKTDYAALRKYIRAANYISAAQIYLWDNVLLQKPLAAAHIKPRLLGHWGTCPGINFVYAHLCRIVKERGVSMQFILGPGHGFPALQANLYLEGTLGKFYPEATHTEEGLRYLASQFSFPYGFPSHSSPATPGVILEGGELGYALSTAYGAAMDSPRRIVACLIGDGEAETGPTAAAWHLHRFVPPQGNGIVFPILHLNGYKISGPTIFGRMKKKELMALFTGYGYKPLYVEIDESVAAESDEPHRTLAHVLDAAMEEIAAASSGVGGAKRRNAWRPPMLILRTPKGWTGIQELRGEKIEGNFLSHQVVAPNAREDDEERAALEAWLCSYRFSELFDPRTGFDADIRALVPKAGSRMGEVLPDVAAPQLSLPAADEFAEDAAVPGTIGSSSMRRAGLFLKRVFEQNKDARNFRLFSPDETYSNKLDAVFGETKRAFSMRQEPWDKDMAEDGRVIEILSEHSLQGMFQGYTLTGRYGLFASYEAFIPIVTSMVDQYLKFLKGAAEVPWRTPLPPLTYILTSSGWRQEHNGFSHQNPGFIGSMLQKPGCFVKVYFPPDGNSMLAVLRACLASKHVVNVIVAGKTQEPRWLTPKLEAKELQQGLMTWDFASDDRPDIVFAAAGDYLTKEALAAVSLLRRDAPEVRVRFVNILELSALGFGSESCRSPLPLSDYFTDDKPVIVNFHGYPQTLRQLLPDGCSGRFSIHGYIENGSTTTPFDMHVRNETSRFHLASEAAALMVQSGVIGAEKGKHIAEAYANALSRHGDYIRKHGVDMPEITEWTWTNRFSS